jgi:tRNA-2-methylthio-N6-dimethylallyladenosine synthase
MKRLYIETYGCQMNVADSQLVESILRQEGYVQCKTPDEADLILINTCSIREHAEERAIARMRELTSFKRKRPGLRVGMIGCMATWNKEKIFDAVPLLDFIAGPDSYRKLPALIEQATENNTHPMDVILSTVETYEDIIPHHEAKGVSAFVSIMRGCNNFCAYCVVPYTRGRERSRSVPSILEEIHHLVELEYKEVTLLGQNVNSYKWKEPNKEWDFPALLARVAQEFPMLRIRFATSHPKDASLQLVETMASYPNIARSIHLPLQSGSNDVLKRMHRHYTLETYKEKIDWFRKFMPDITISTDIIAGYSGETEDDHRATMQAMREIHFFYAYMFKYSERPGTLASKKYPDDVPDEVKTRRLEEIIHLQQQLSYEHNLQDIGKLYEVLIEGVSKKNPNKWYGRTSQNKVVVFSEPTAHIGDFVKVKITSVTPATLLGEPYKDK